MASMTLSTRPPHSPIKAVKRGFGHVRRSIGRALGVYERRDDPRRRFYVDVSELVRRDAGTGIQRVTRAVVQTLHDHPPAGFCVELVYADPARPGYRLARRFAQRFFHAPGGNARDRLIDPRQGDIFFGLDLQPEIVLHRSDDLDALQRRGVRIVFYVYDLLPIALPQHFTARDTALHEAWLTAIARFDGAICSSAAIAEELNAWLTENAPKRDKPFGIAWGPYGANIEATVPTGGLPDDAETLLARLGHAPTFLLVATLEPRKGHRQTLAAFERLWAKGVDANLVLVGRRGWMMDDVIDSLATHPEHTKRLFWLEGISDEYLNRVYDAATCLLVPSEGEGFGLPLIEAARHDLPILARDIPVFREVAGTHAAYFSGLAADDLAAAISDWLQSYENNQHPRSGTMPMISWRESVDALVDILVNQRWTRTWPPDARERSGSP